jgi:uncharacterized protein YxjI
MEVKVQCDCGTRYAFEVEPVRGRMPVTVQCPSCGTDGTAAANELIARQSPPGAPPPPPPPPAPSGARLRVAGAAAASETPPAAANAWGHFSAPRSLLDRTTFFVKERVAVLKLTDTYDILDPATSQPIGIAKEEPPAWAKWLRLLVNKQLLPTVVNIYEVEGQPPVASVHRGFTLLRSKIRVLAADRSSLGYFKSKLFSLGGGFHVFDNLDQRVAEVKGDWKGWNFKFLNQHGREIGTVTKKWAGLGKELFTSADNYIISLSDLSGVNLETSALLLAAGLSIDIVFKESK